MTKYIDTNELYNKLRGRISVRQLEIIKELINECDTITVESEDEWWMKDFYPEEKGKITARGG